MNGAPTACDAKDDPGRLAHLRSRVLAWARIWCRGAEDEADDLTQEVMVRVLSRLHQFRGEAKLTSWTYAVARSVFVSHVREASRRARSERLYATGAMPSSAEAWPEEDDRFAGGQAVHWLRTWTAHGVLSQEERSTIELVVLGGLSATQAGSILGIAPGSVRARVCRAARRIRARAMAGVAALWLGVWAGSGCSSDGGSSRVAMRDSAGVTIVESFGPAWTSETAWTVDAAPMLDLGQTGSGPMHEFYRVTGGTFGVDGGIIVTNRGSSEVRFYDEEGRFTAVLGADGDGPGEFRWVGGVRRYAGDSLVAFDPRVARGTVITASGSLGRIVTFAVPERTVISELDPLYVSELAGFFVVATVMPPGIPPPGIARFPQLVLELSATGALVDTVAAMRGFEQYLGPIGIDTLPLARFSHGAVHRDELHLCDGERAEYAVFARDGTKKRIVRLPHLSLDVPADVIDSIQASLKTGRENLRAMAEAVPTTYPSCSGLLVDALGYVWLERYHPPFRTSDEPRSWLIFSPDGEWLGQLDFPANFEVFEVDESRVLAVIEQVADLVIAADGTVYVVDRQADQVHVVDASGQRRPSIGRRGAGPGEFAQPTSLEVVGDTLFVADVGNSRLQALSLAGVPLLTRALPGYYPPSIGAGTHFVQPTLGMDTVLAVIHRPDLSQVAGIGRIVGTPSREVNPSLMKREIRDGTVPAIFLNTAEAVIGPDSSTWLYVPARGTVQRFDAEGRELWSVRLVEPEREQLVDDFRDANAAKPTGPFALLRYVLDLTLVGKDAWVLLGNSLTGPAAVRVLSAGGVLGERLEFPGVSGVDQVAVDPARGFIYFVQPDAAQLIRIPWRTGT